MIIVLADLLALAVAIAISPLSIVAVILMATSGKARSNGTAFILGGYSFMVVFVGLLVIGGRLLDTENSRSIPHLLVDGLEIALGAFLLVMAVRQWLKRSEEGPPAWMGKLDSLTLVNAFVVGVLLAGPLSPKDLPLLIAAGGRISQADLPAEQLVGVVLIFAAISITAVALPWLISVMFPDKAEATLSGPRDWLIANHSVIVSVLFVVLGFKLIGSGVIDLVS